MRKWQRKREYGFGTENTEEDSTYLQTEYKSEKVNYIEIKNTIPSETIEAVQTERTEIQADGIRQTRRELENIYKGKFNGDIFEEVQKRVNNDLDEKTLKKSLIQQVKQEEQKQSIANKHKNHEIER